MGSVSGKQPAEEPAHDILAAEAFAVPAPDPVLCRRVVLPDDPAGIAEPHDILAAEEFAMPAPGRGRNTRSSAEPGSREGHAWGWVSASGLLALWLWRRRR